MIELTPGNLTWDEADPARHPFDSAAAARVVRSLEPARRVPAERGPDVSFADRATSAWSRREGVPWADAMSQALVQQYGRWVVGWRWAHAEGDFDGGPVGSWCCPLHSITTPEETLAHVVAAVCEWRAWLESLAKWFERYPLDLETVDDQRILWEYAARNLILQVVDRTGCSSGWYGHCRQVLTWFLSRWGVATDVAQDLVDEAIGGRFQSWAGPDVVLVDDVAERLVRTLRPADGARPAEQGAEPEPEPKPDHLRRWLAVRETVPWEEASGGSTSREDVTEPVTPSRDGAADDIHAFDGALDPTRTAGLLAALDLLRADAARGATLDFPLLRRWQQHVLGTQQPPRFRTLPAFAKGGRERYGIAPDTRTRLDVCLAESTMDKDRPLPLTARAARAYLDVCFFHPFDDGNARSAFLALVFVLAREGVALDSVSLLRRIAVRADSAQDALRLARFVGLHVEGTRQRAVPAP